MAEPFLSELRLFAVDFPPKGWAFCNGQLLPISQNGPLFSLLGTTYGGDGRSTFGLPNLQGRLPIHAGQGLPLGTRAGESSHTVTLQEMPQHTHLVNASQLDGNTFEPDGTVLAGAANLYGPAASLTTVEPSTVSSVGGSAPHSNMQPYLALSWCIALQGLFPSPN